MVFLLVGSIFISKIPSNREFLVNTGASCSVFPHHSSAPPSGPRLLMADGCPTKSWGSRMLPLQFGNPHLEFPFLLAAVDRHILEAYFLAESDLLVDSAKRQVFQPLAPPVSLTVNTAIASVFILAPDVSSLLDEFPAAWKPCLPGKLPGQQAEHVIKM